MVTIWLIRVIRWLFNNLAWLIGPKAASLATITDYDLNHIRLRAYRPTLEADLPLIVFYHGGGWMIGGIAAYDRLCQALAVKSGCVVLSVEYRLAPEYPFPAAVDDALAAYIWAGENARSLGVNAKRMIVVGDSAGGNLAAVVTHAMGRTPNPPIGQILMYPVLDLRLPRDRGSRLYQRIFHRIFDVHRHHYLRNCELAEDDRASPGLHVPETLPPTCIITAGRDILTEQACEYVKRCNRITQLVRWHHYKTAVHGFIQFAGVYSPAAEALELIAAFAQDITAVQSKR
jgi:acetyl esterase